MWVPQCNAQRFEWTGEQLRVKAEERVYLRLSRSLLVTSCQCFSAAFGIACFLAVETHDYKNEETLRYRTSHNHTFTPQVPYRRPYWHRQLVLSYPAWLQTVHLFHPVRGAGPVPQGQTQAILRLPSLWQGPGRLDHFCLRVWGHPWKTQPISMGWCNMTSPAYSFCVEGLPWSLAVEIG